MTLMLAACDIGKVTVPATAGMVVVHAVLNPGFSTQVVLLERTFTGTIAHRDTVFNDNDPIASSGGIPVSDALVEILDSAGQSFRGVEDRTVAAYKGKGAGVYRIALSGSTLTGGAQYQLHVRTTEGENLTAFTRVPRATPTDQGVVYRPFNRSRDTLFVGWSAVDAARTYAVQIESPFGPFFLFTDSTRFRITGNLRNPFAKDLPRVFIPGFLQDIAVTAVDSNFYDYYRTNNDPFTGSGIISRVTGGLGLFGSLVEISSLVLPVDADQHGGIEGRFRRVNSASSSTVTELNLYVESPSARSELPDALSGRYILFGPGSAFKQSEGGLIGQFRDSTVTLALLTNQLAGDTAAVFSGRLRGDSLIGNYRGTPGAAIYVRAP